MKNPFDTPEREEFRAQLKAFVDKEIKPYVNDWDEEGKVPWELHQKAGALGVWGFGIDEKYGGLGEDDNFLRAIYNEEFAKCGAGGGWRVDGWQNDFFGTDTKALFSRDKR